MNKLDLQNLASKLTLDEKIGMIHGCALFKTKAVEHLSIPAMISSDGPMGCRLEYEETEWFPKGKTDDFTSYLPSNSALAATFNPELAYLSGQVLGEEARGRGKDMILAPGVNIHRDPLCGRNFEYFSEDPHLICEMAIPFIKGIQESDVSACVKHFALNNQETKRMSVNAVVSERALWEIYLPAFKASIHKADCKSVMGAYNKYKDQFCCHNKILLDDILRTEWGFEGIVISDWGGVHDTVSAATTSLDIEMSVTSDFDEYFMANPLKKAILEGSLSESLVDQKVLHILNVMNDLHMLDGERKSGTYNHPDSRAKLLKTAEESVILLKNETNLLPLNKKKLKKLLVLGDNADRIHANGGGSAEIKALYEISPLLGLKMLIGGNCEVIHEPAYYARVIGNAWGIDSGENWQATSLSEDRELAVKNNRILPQETIIELNKQYLERAKELATQADAVIFVGGLNHDYDVEGRDRDDMKLPYGQDAIIKELLKIRPDMIVTILAGSPVEMKEWQDDAQSIVFSYFAGMESGLALAKVLLGDCNPSGKLPTTFPISLSDSPSQCIGEFPGDDSVHYKEDIYVGYRYYDTKNIPVAFPFGHGLSYTDFSYKTLNCELLESPQENKLTATLTLSIQNTGSVSGQESVQIYIRPINSSIERPEKELRAFQKVSLNPSEHTTLSITLDQTAFSFYNEERKCYETPAGDYEILAASSSRDIRLFTNVTLQHQYLIKR